MKSKYSVEILGHNVKIIDPVFDRKVAKGIRENSTKILVGATLMGAALEVACSPQINTTDAQATAAAARQTGIAEGYNAARVTPTVDLPATIVALQTKVVEGNGKVEVNPTLAPARVTATAPAVKPAVTVDSMLHEAAVNYAGKVNRPVDEVEKMMKAMFQSVTAQHMPFLSASTKGLVPNETQARSFKEFKKGETLTVEASTRGYYEISGGYFTGNVNGVTVDYPWRDKRTVHLFFMAPLDKEAKINITDIAPGGAYGIGASYGYDQVNQYGGQSRTMIDPIRIADGVTQAVYRDGIADGQNGPAQEVVAFVDTITGQITEYTFTNKTGGWQKTK